MDKKPAVVILEDDIAILEIFKRVLKNEGEIYTCCSIDCFDDVISKTKIDLFIIDLALGEKKNGIEVIRELRETAKYKFTPILVVTAHAYHSDEYNAREAGADKFLRKPVENLTLLETVRELIK